MKMEEMTMDFAEVMTNAVYAITEAIGDHYEDFGEELTYQICEKHEKALKVLGAFTRENIAAAQAADEAHKETIYAEVMEEADKAYTAINIQKQAAEIILNETRRNGYQFDQETFCAIEGTAAETVQDLKKFTEKELAARAAEIRKAAIIVEAVKAMTAALFGTQITN